MFLPADFAWLQPIIIASVIVFVVDLIGNSISFGSKILNALVTALLFGVIFTVLVYFKLGGVSIAINIPG